MKVNILNRPTGTIVSVERDETMTKTKIDLGNGVVITSVIPNTNADELNLKEGLQVQAIIKSTDVKIFPRPVTADDHNHPHHKCNCNH